MQAAEAEVEAVAEQTPRDPGASFKGKKSKAAAKQGTAKRQWEILRDSGIPEAEIAEFGKTSHWLRYFPPLAMRDMTAMGCGIDWRRSFITTDVNQYYDSFVQWQFRVLKRQGRVYRDKRSGKVLLQCLCVYLFGGRAGRRCGAWDTDVPPKNGQSRLAML